MNLRNISTQEIRRVSRICERVHRTTSSEPFTNHLFVVLKEALPGIHFTIDRFTLTPLTLHKPLNESLPDSTFRLFEIFMHEHPGLLQYMAANQQVGSMLTALPPSQYRKTALYNEVYRPVNIDDQIWLGVGDRHELIAASFSRDTAYTELDHLKLALIQPQIHIAWKNWQRIRALETQLGDLKASPIQSGEQARKAKNMERALQALTPRQREIVDRVAAGKTNREIAADLKISPRTVEKHLEHIFTALGVRSRAAIPYEISIDMNRAMPCNV